ncbi:pyrroline-5-carboxylate reductase [Bacillus sp. AFS040349]|uniref:pyrroline-5-carboxylate reductase n=1 Tax=Bacillus sp. AFS040349 TaxID=2033502 RepID=UPI000BFD5691|nr:pyrroline-5-carboxylate reductase [Bacillus sp. AFS040349]PGT80290.1 pyrroline-5-carboxylate reductase [Bacillus sp. AFS040349]
MFGKMKIAFIGAGNMAEALISGFVSTMDCPETQIVVTNRGNKARLLELRDKYSVEITSREALNFNNIDILFLTVKPKDIDSALQELSTKLTRKTIIMSVVAGVSTDYIELALPLHQPVIRVMPNTSCMLMESATAICSGTYATGRHLLIAHEFLKCLGRVFVIDENQMDIFTGVAGSGPAYFYYLMEQMEKTCAEEGMDIELAREISAQTMLGAARMILEYSASPSRLRANVTSPNGTTEAGVEELIKYGAGRAISQAIRGAQKRSMEITSILQMERSNSN